MNTDMLTRDQSEPFSQINHDASIPSRFARDSLTALKYPSPGRILLILVGGIAIAEVFAMAVVYFVRDWSYVLQVLLDATLMTLIIFPLLYLLVFKPLLLQIEQRQQSESIIQSRLRLMQYANTHEIEELLQFALDEIETVTGSTIGFFHFLEVDQKTLWLRVWSTRTLQFMCKADGKDTHYNVDEAGIWADAVRTRQPILHNNYAELHNRKSLPDGHATLVRELVVPILRKNNIVGILGLGNKPQAYNTDDVKNVTTFADFAWDIIEHKQADIALHQSEEKFRTLADWTFDWEAWLSPQGKVIYASPSCERITGYKPEEFIGDPDLMTRIIHPDDQVSYKEHLASSHTSGGDPTGIQFRIMARDGTEHWIEHICRSIMMPDDHLLGRRVSNRDISERKKADMKITEHHQKELHLTQTIQTMQNDIGRDLHDTLGQNISFLLMNLKNLAEAPSIDPVVAKLQIQYMIKAANEAHDLIRAMLAVLQNGESTDPIVLFTRYSQQVAERSSFRSVITSRGGARMLSSHQIRQLFYIYREALSNIEKYANANEVSAEFQWGDKQLTFLIRDNGCGFDSDVLPPDNHYGLKFMRERAELMRGSLSIQTVAGCGTSISVVVPYDNFHSA